MGASVLLLRTVEFVAADDDNLITVRELWWLRSVWLWLPFKRIVGIAMVFSLAHGILVVVTLNTVAAIIWCFVPANNSSVLFISVDGKVRH